MRSHRCVDVCICALARGWTNIAVIITSIAITTAITTTTKGIAITTKAIATTIALTITLVIVLVLRRPSFAQPLPAPLNTMSRLA